MRLLLVEDDPNMSGFISKGLRELAYAVDVAATGDEALYQAAINTYDLIMLDVMIPGPDGFEVCRSLRNSGQKMPILMLTARDAVSDRVAGLDHGADDYLTKPFQFSELTARLRALLRRPRDMRPPTITVSDLIVDTAAQTAYRGDRVIPLTRTEFALLEFLSRKAGIVVGRSEIAEHVWDSAFDPFSNLIEVYVNRLRRKLTVGSEHALLHTRRGAGYILADIGSTPTSDTAEASDAAPQKAGYD